MTESGPDLPARTAPGWVRDGVVYEVFPRAFSPTGDFAGVTARLDELHNLGVTVLWIMPIHPIGGDRRKGTLGRPYAVQDYYPIDPAYGARPTSGGSCARPTPRPARDPRRRREPHAWDSVLMDPELYMHDAQARSGPERRLDDVAGLDYANPELRRHMTRCYALDARLRPRRIPVRRGGSRADGLLGRGPGRAARGSSPTCSCSPSGTSPICW